jgi:hypothetical protein
MEIVLFSEVWRQSGGLMCINLPREVRRVILDLFICERDVTAELSAYQRFSLSSIYKLFLVYFPYGIFIFLCACRCVSVHQFLLLLP